MKCSKLGIECRHAVRTTHAALVCMATEDECMRARVEAAAADASKAYAPQELLATDPEKALLYAKKDSGLQDSGQRKTFETGAMRDRGTLKFRPDLIHPYFLERFGLHMAKGAIKYSDHNWAKGMPTSEYWASLNRHVTQAAAGDTSEDHLAAIAFNVMGIMYNQEMAKRGKLPASMNDWPVDWDNMIKVQEPQ